jgi:hypothetical protein
MRFVARPKAKPRTTTGLTRAVRKKRKKSCSTAAVRSPPRYLQRSGGPIKSPGWVVVQPERSLDLGVDAAAESRRSAQLDYA